MMSPMAEGRPISARRSRAGATSLTPCRRHPRRSPTRANRVTFSSLASRASKGGPTAWNPRRWRARRASWTGRWSPMSSGRTHPSPFARPKRSPTAGASTASAGFDQRSGAGERLSCRTRLFRLAQSAQRFQGRLALCLLLALAPAAAQFEPLVKNGTLEKAVVVRTCHASQLVLGSIRRSRLEQLLQLPFGILQVKDLDQLADGVAKATQNELSGRVVTAVEEDRAQQRFQRVGQRRRTLACAAGFFAATEDEMLADAEAAGFGGKRAAVDHLSAGFGQGSFAEAGKFFVELAGQDQAEHGVAEKFQALVVGRVAWRLVGHARVRQ